MSGVKNELRGVAVFGSNRDFIRVCKTSPQWDEIVKTKNKFGEAPGIHGMCYVGRGNDEYIVIGFHKSSSHGSVARYKLQGKQVVPDLDYKGTGDDVRSLFVLDDLLFALPLHGRKISVFNFDTGENLGSIEENRGVLSRMDVNRGKKQICSFFQDDKLAFWDISTRKVVRKVEKIIGGQKLHFSQGKKMLFVGTSGEVNVFNEDGRLMNELQLSPGKEATYDIVCNDRRDEVIVSHDSEPSYMSCYDLRMMKLRKNWLSDDWDSQRIALVEPENRVISSSSNGHMRTWDGNNDFRMVCEREFNDAVNSLVYVPRINEFGVSRSEEEEEEANYTRANFDYDDLEGEFKTHNVNPGNDKGVSDSIRVCKEEGYAAFALHPKGTVCNGFKKLVGKTTPKESPWNLYVRDDIMKKIQNRAGVSVVIQ